LIEMPERIFLASLKIWIACVFFGSLISLVFFGQLSNADGLFMTACFVAILISGLFGLPAFILIFLVLLWLEEFSFKTRTNFLICSFLSLLFVVVTFHVSIDYVGEDLWSITTCYEIAVEIGVAWAFWKVLLDSNPKSKKIADILDQPL